MGLGKEDETHEFKESISQLDKAVLSLTAMLNRHQKGAVYIGVLDDGTVKGIDIGPDTLMKVRNKIRDLVSPQIVCEISDRVDDSGKHYIEISAEGSNIPYSFDGRYYVRNVSANESADQNVLRKMLLSGDTDLLIQMESPRDDLTFKKLISALTGNGIHILSEEQLISGYKLKNRSGSYNLMSYLLSDQNAVKIKMVRFAGTDKVKMLERKEYTDESMLVAFEGILDYISALNSVRVDLSQGRRSELPLFSQDAFREAWINACLHNTWIEMVPPSVYVYDDRIEVVSYGGLPFGLSKDSFFKGDTRPVNKQLMNVFISAGLAEQSGHGVPTIVSECGKGAFSFDSDMLKVTIPFNYEPDIVQVRKATERNLSSLTDNQYKVYSYLKDNPEATFKQVSADTSLSVPGISKIVARLQELGLLERQGSKKNGHWMTK